MSQYVASIPTDGTVKPSIQSFFEKFYAVSDSPDGHDAYADMLTDDGVLIMGPNKTQGRESSSAAAEGSTLPLLTLPFYPNGFVDIIKMRHGMWEKVAKRSHKPLKIFAFGKDSNDVMLFGTVDYTLKDGKSTGIEWAAHAHFVEEGGSLKMDHYQVYLDTASMTPK